nr:TetR/AcrR family transcriptional regulator [Eubacterium sp.]
MKDEKATKQKLLMAAKSEFMEKGYTKASLRSICRQAGVTTGALYFFFQDKEDLFASLVEQPVRQLMELMMSHYEEESDERELQKVCSMDFEEDFSEMAQIVHYMYQYYDEFLMVLTKAQGSRFENFVDQSVDITEKHYRMIADRLSQMMQKPRLEDDIVHWVSHTQINAFVHVLTHETSEEKAMVYMKTVVKFLISGWLAILGILDENNGK